MPPQNQIPSTTPYAFPHDSTLSPSTTALLIIDMQRDFLCQGGYMSHQGYDISRCQSIISVTQALLRSFRGASFPIFHTREGHEPHMATVSSRELHRSAANGGQIGSQGPLGRLLIRGEEGHDIIPEMAPIEGEPVVDKPGRGAFANTDLDLMLRNKGVKNLVVCGVTMDACVSTTVREASDRGYDVCVAEDAVESVNEELKRWSLEALKIEGGLFGVVGNSQDIIKAVDNWVTT